MAKSKERLIARSLRSQGESVKSIAKYLRVSKSTASLWVRDIILSVKQLENIKNHGIKGSERGRLLGALKQKNDRLKRIEDGRHEGQKIFSDLTKKELLAAGCALYWAEGTKKQRIVSFCNSDPNLINFMIAWLSVCFQIPFDELSCYVGINEIHAQREKEVKQYWSTITKIPITQFTKTSLKKTQNKKIYDNLKEHYGTLTVKVLRSARFYYKILGLIEGMYKTQNKARVAQW